MESYFYGTNNRTITVKEGNGNDYLYNYDGFGRLVNEVNRAGLEQNYFYDEEGQLKSKSNFDETTTTINYSSDRTVKTIHYSHGSENRFVYDAIGNIIEAENAYGKTIYQHDQGGRLIYQKDVTTGEEIRFEYDDAGNRTRLYSSNRETLYIYGKNNEVKEIFDNKQRLSIKLKYDKIGREILRKFGNGTAVYTLYDKAGRVTVKMQKPESGELLWCEGYVYGADGKRTATVDSSGCVTLYEYDRQGRLSSVYYPYTDEMINNLKTEAAENGLSSSEDAGENKYLPSEIRNQLIPLLNSMQYGLAYSLSNLHIFIKETYSYDKNGNRTSKTTPYGTIEYSYDKENCLISSGSKEQVYINYTYDSMGNLLTEESENKTVKYAYNLQNRLIYCEVTDRANKEYAQTTYAYDAFGRRVIVQDKGEAALRALYDGLTFDVIKQSPTLANGMFTDSYETGIRWGNTGRPTGDRYRYLGDDDTKDNNRYFYLDENTYKTVNSRYKGERTAISVNGTVAAQTTADYGAEYFTTDLLGSVRSTTDSYGTAKSTYTYDAFGSLIQGELKGSADYGYLGKPYDPTTNLYNYGYRDYKPTTARFTTTDPIRDGHNWYTYCDGDSINYKDLNGLFGIATITGTICGGITGGISAVMQDKNSFKEVIAGVAGGAISGAIAGAAVDLSVYTGGAAAIIIIAAGGALGGATGSITESKINGESIKTSNVICDAAIGAGSAVLGCCAGKIMNNTITNKVSKMLSNPGTKIGKDVLLNVSQKTGNISIKLGKTVDKVTIAGTTQLIYAGLSLASDITQDKVNPGMNNGENNENSDTGKLDNKNK